MASDLCHAFTKRDEIREAGKTCHSETASEQLGEPGRLQLRATDAASDRLMREHNFG